jgi:toxin ParE1/3/4
VRLVLTPKAVRDLDSIWDYSADRWGVAQADRYVEALHEACAALAQSPAAGRDASDIRAGYRKCRCGRHVVFAHDRGDGVLVVVRILHGRMDPAAHLEADG